MADKTLNDVVDSLKSVEDAVKDPPKSAADVEAATEKARADAEQKGIFQGIYNTLQKGFGAATTADKKQGGLIAGLLGGIGAGLGTIAKGIAKIGPKFVLGMGSLALGIGAFMLGLGGAGKIAEFIGVDGSSINTLVSNVFGAFTGVDLVAMGALIAAGIVVGK